MVLRGLNNGVMNAYDLYRFARAKPFVADPGVAPGEDTSCKGNVKVWHASGNVKGMSASLFCEKLAQSIDVKIGGILAPPEASSRFGGPRTVHRGERNTRGRFSIKMPFSKSDGKTPLRNPTAAEDVTQQRRIQFCPGLLCHRGYNGGNGEVYGGDHSRAGKLKQSKPAYQHCQYKDCPNKSQAAPKKKANTVWFCGACGISYCAEPGPKPEKKNSYATPAQCWALDRPGQASKDATMVAPSCFMLAHKEGAACALKNAEDRYNASLCPDSSRASSSSSSSSALQHPRQLFFSPATTSEKRRRQQGDDCDGERDGAAPQRQRRGEGD